MPADLSLHAPKAQPGRLGAVLPPRIAYGLAAPAVLLLVATVIAPILVMIALSFTDYRFGEAGLRWTGLGNYLQLLDDRTFKRALWNTFAYVAMVAPASVLLGLFLAVLIDALDRGQRFYRLVFFLPVTATLVAMAMVWKYLLHGTIGPFNLMLQSLGLPSLDVFGDRDLALAGLAAINVWSLAGFNMVLFSAGLTGVPQDLYDAAAMDGMDSRLDRFLNVTLPLLGPTTLFAVVTSTITAFKVFDTVAVVTRGGPRGSTDVLLYTTYLEGFSYFRMGSAAAMTVVFLAIMMVFAWIQARVLDRKVHY
ncbi:carbohydrate ABC transporter membrane protein 1, CUT1 family [Paracoccus thiocyanatus]|uniref:Carbohydrate ABC transporter membrane protein 1, CUT1 family n=1 Tax=Paracoccus thiocyanatus TaxID=34006 RepID=A0A1N6VYX3_9RHOB|nr:sugar ABC transporter permease [Paracoccus thiocyanatus]SIQ83024.1 carbohydrate ABC transporter membrane protein 1, CUT1 family [Paracoccus thiocyanatus]